MSGSSRLQDTLLAQLFIWCWSRSFAALMVSLILVVGSALGVVYVTHMNRQLYAQLQNLQRDQDVLESEYERLLLEQSAWSDYSRVEKLTKSELVMKMPVETDVVVVRY